MRMSSGSRCGRRSAMVFSTAAAGTINHIARGLSSFSTSNSIRSRFFRSSSAGLYASTFKYVHKLPITAGNFGRSRVSRHLPGPPVNERLPEDCAAHREADESRDSGRRHQPFTHLFVVFAATQNDAADFVTPALSSSIHDFLAVFATIESFNLPNVWLHVSILELLDGLDHQSRAKLKVVDFLVAFDAIELRFLRRYDELKQKLAATLLTIEVFREPAQPS